MSDLMAKKKKKCINRVPDKAFVVPPCPVNFLLSLNSVILGLGAAGCLCL